MFDESTLLVIQKMDALVEQIIANINNLGTLTKDYLTSSEESAILKARALVIINDELFQIAEYF